MPLHFKGLMRQYNAKVVCYNSITNQCPITINTQKPHQQIRPFISCCYHYRYCIRHSVSQLVQQTDVVMYTMEKWEKNNRKRNWKVETNCKVQETQLPHRNLATLHIIQCRLIQTQTLAVPGSEFGSQMVIAEREPVTGVWVQSPRGV